MLEGSHPNQKTNWIVGIGLAIAGVVGGVIAVQQVSDVISAAERPATVMFDHGLSGVVTKAPRQWTNEFCGSCHKQVFEQWAHSRHAVSGTTHNFEVEFLKPAGGRQQHCINCHAPMNPTGELFPTEEPSGIDAAYEKKAPWVATGIDCLTCHVRDGKVLVTKHSDKAAGAHPIQVAPELGTAEFCAGCHQFSFKSSVLPDGYFGQLQQASFEEFLDFRREIGGAFRCHECHLPDGDHSMPGGYDDEMVRQAISLDVAAKRNDESASALISVDVIAGHVGHRIPGGEHFRFFTVETSLSDASGKSLGAIVARSPGGEAVIKHSPIIETLRRQMGSVEQGSDNPNDQPLPDTRLWPGETRTYRYQTPIDSRGFIEPLKIRVELWYHLMDEDKAKSLDHPLEDVRRKIMTRETTLEIETVSPSKPN